MATPPRYKIVWTFKANEDLADIYEYYLLSEFLIQDRVLLN